DRHRAVRWTGGLQPRIAHTGDVRALTPGPLAILLQVVALDLPSIGQVEGVGTLPFHEERAFVGRRDMAHELRIAEPTIRHDHRRWQRDTVSAERCHAVIEHALHPVQFVAARRPRAGGVRPPDGKVHGHHEFAIADHHHQEDAINPGEHPVFLPTPPGAHQTQLLAVLFEYRIIRNPGPLPAAARGCTLVGSRAPQRYQYLYAQASQALDPGAFGECTEQPRGEVFIPSPYAAEFRVGATAKERRTHHPDDFPQEFVLAAQAPFDLSHQVF